MSRPRYLDREVQQCDVDVAPELSPWDLQAWGKRRNRRKISAKKRAAVYDRDGHACVRCGSPEDLTLDHKVPLVKGGSNEVSNLQTMCRSCNNWKADSDAA